MILLNEVEVFDENDLNHFLEYLDSIAYTDQQKEDTKIMVDYVTRVFEANQKLQTMVSENLSEDLLSCVILPFRPIDNFDEFKFKLINVENGKIRKRDTLMYEKYCDICFGSVPGIYSLALAYYGE